MRMSGRPESNRLACKGIPRNPARFLVVAACFVFMLASSVSSAHAWNDQVFKNSPIVGYPIPQGKNNIIGSLISYKLRKGDTLLDVGRWFGLTGAEVSDANDHMDWWAPPVGRKIILPDEHILPDAPHVGIVLNVPELRLYYYYPSPTVRAKSSKVKPEVVYTFPVGLGRFDWRTPMGKTYITNKTVNPPWVVPNDIYKEHLERDGWAVHVVPGGIPDNPLGHYHMSLSLPMYAIHGTSMPWGVGMMVSHGCIRLYPEDIKRLFHMTPVGTPVRIVYEPIKFGWRGNALYVEVHRDVYHKYPNLWNLAMKLVAHKHLRQYIDFNKLEVAVKAETGVPTYIMPGVPPPGSYTVEEARLVRAQPG